MDTFFITPNYKDLPGPDQELLRLNPVDIFFASGVGFPLHSYIFYIITQ